MVPFFGCGSDERAILRVKEEGWEWIEDEVEVQVGVEVGAADYLEIFGFC